MSAILQCGRITAGYHHTVVLQDASFSVPAGRSIGLVGPNGAGKTTLLRAIMGLCDVRSGTITFAGRNVSELTTHERAHAGLGYVPQERKIFRSLTVRDNLRIVAAEGRGTGDRQIEACLHWFPRLRERYGVAAGSLSGGEQQMLAIALAVVRQPQILLLDEPTLGLAPTAREAVADRLLEICREFGTATLTVEQDLGVLRLLTNEAYVIRSGSVWGPIDLDAVTDLTEVL